jgi:hypothetical protein
MRLFVFKSTACVSPMPTVTTDDSGSLCGSVYPRAEAGADRRCLARGSQLTDPKWPIVNARFRRSEIHGCFHLRWPRGIHPATKKSKNNECYECQQWLGPGHAREYDVFRDGRNRRLPLAVIALQLRDLASLVTEVICIVHRPLDLTGSSRPAGVAGGGDHIAIVANPNWIGSAASHQQQGNENCVSHGKLHSAVRLYQNAPDRRTSAIRQPANRGSGSKALYAEHLSGSQFDCHCVGGRKSHLHRRMTKSLWCHQSYCGR